MEGRPISSSDLVVAAKPIVFRLIGSIISEHLSILSLLAAFALFVKILEIIAGKHPSINLNCELYHTFALLCIVIFFRNTNIFKIILLKGT
jgi:hypothetical protein